MADNILTKDRDGANIALAAKDIEGVLFPRNILTDAVGNDVIPLTDEQLRAAPVQVSANSLPLPAGAATDATAQALQSLSDAMLYMLSSILEKMPRVDAADRILINGSEVSAAVTISNGTVTTVSNQTNVGGRDAAHTSFALANMGALHIYNNIQVTA